LLQDTLLLLKGYAAGPQHNASGSGSNFLCLHEEPQWATYVDGQQRFTGSVYGAVYAFPTHSRNSEHSNIFSSRNSRALRQMPAPCALCDVPGRSRTAMIPARTQCPDGWTTEYAGYLVSEFQYPNRKRSSYICLDEAPEIAVGNSSTWQSIFYPVEVECGTLPCSVYISGRELTCVVCSK